jgi:hypothetical protein
MPHKQQIGMTAMTAMIVMLRTLNLRLETLIHSTMCILAPPRSNAPSLMLNKHMQMIRLSGSFEVALNGHSRRSSAEMTAQYKFKLLKDYQ